ncbi:hypothetical protein JW905_11005 [bacterium]|nr:hypothetical protein [candidate division CSSED10-310 bacterium]
MTINTPMTAFVLMLVLFLGGVALIVLLVMLVWRRKPYRFTLTVDQEQPRSCALSPLMRKVPVIAAVNDRRGGRYNTRSAASLLAGRRIKVGRFKRCGKSIKFKPAPGWKVVEPYAQRELFARMNSKRLFTVARRTDSRTSVRLAVEPAAGNELTDSRKPRRKPRRTVTSSSGGDMIRNETKKDESQTP